ncbi:MAG: serine hydrolase [Blastocatellia bacterium]|nr:serine hydrolase [Blastocatellia bacterium]
MASAYGLGILSEPLRSGTILSHGGGGGGYKTFQVLTPEYQIGVVVLMNSETGDQRIAMDVFLQMLEVKYGPDSRTPPAGFTDKPIIEVDTKLLQCLAGTYKISSYVEAFKGYLATFKVKEDNLYIVSGTTDVKLNAHSPTEFTWRDQKFTFVLDEKGKPKGIWYLNPPIQAEVRDQTRERKFSSTKSLRIRNGRGLSTIAIAFRLSISETNQGSRRAGTQRIQTGVSIFNSSHNCSAVAASSASMRSSSSSNGSAIICGSR